MTSGSITIVIALLFLFSHADNEVRIVIKLMSAIGLDMSVKRRKRSASCSIVYSVLFCRLYLILVFFIIDMKLIINSYIGLIAVSVVQYVCVSKHSSCKY